MDYSLWSCKESDMTEHTCNTTFILGGYKFLRVTFLMVHTSKQCGRGEIENPNSVLKQPKTFIKETEMQNQGQPLAEILEFRYLFFYQQ